jgi:hypothetical protein
MLAPTFATDTMTENLPSVILELEGVSGAWLADLTYGITTLVRLPFLFVFDSSTELN